MTYVCGDRGLRPCGLGPRRDLVARGLRRRRHRREPRRRSICWATTSPASSSSGAALDWDVLREAGIEGADAFVACTDGDNTNIVDRPDRAEEVRDHAAWWRACYDPLRAELFAQAGIRTVCPTRDVRVALLDAVRACQLPAAEG